MHEVSGGRWLIVGGGGYDPADVTPRAWTAFFGTVLGKQTESVALPAAWLHASRAKGGHPPAHLLDDSGAAFVAPSRPGLHQLPRRDRGGTLSPSCESASGETRATNKAFGRILHCAAGNAYIAPLEILKEEIMGVPKVDPDLCTGCGICEDICPDVFEVADDGLSHVIDPNACEDAGCCEEAADECPEGAITIE